MSDSSMNHPGVLVNKQVISSYHLAIAYSPYLLVEFFNSLLFIIQNFELIISQVKQVEQGHQKFTLCPSVAATHHRHSVLLRSARLLKSIFHIYRGYTSFGAVNKVNDGVEKISFSRSDFLETTKNGNFIWADQPFGNIDFDGENGVLAFDAIIGANECFNVVAFMGGIVSAVLKGQYTKLEAVAGTAKNIARTISETMSFSDQKITRGPSEAHWVIVITDLHNQIYALDLTGVQYGWNEDLMPWDQYANDRFEKHSERIPLEHVRTIWNQESLPSRAHMLASSQAEDHVIRAIELTLKEWSRKERMDMFTLFELEEEEYQMKSYKMILAAVIAIESLIEMFKRRKMFLWYTDGEGELRLTRSEREARRVGL